MYLLVKTHFNGGIPSGCFLSISIHIICSPTLPLECLLFASASATVHIFAFPSNMAESTGRKNLETQLKKVALASACTLTGPTGFETPDPGHGSFDETSCSFGPLTRHVVLTLFLC